MVGLFGPVSSGKTHLIKQWLREQNRFVGFDYSGELLDYETIVGSPKRLLDRLLENPYLFRIAYVPGPNIDEDFKWVLWSLWHLPVTKLLVCDEVHRIIPLSGVSPEAETLLRFARHANVGFIGASQRIADVSKLFTSACRTVVLFWTQEARDLQAINDRWGCADLVANLRPLIYDDFAKVTRQTPQIVVCRKGLKPEVVTL